MNRPSHDRAQGLYVAVRRRCAPSVAVAAVRETILPRTVWIILTWLAALAAVLCGRVACSQTPAAAGQTILDHGPLETNDQLPLKVNPNQTEADYPVWWTKLIQDPLGEPKTALPIELDRAVIQALQCAARVRVLRSTAAIADTAITRAEAIFDPVAFADTKFVDTSDPVGNRLQTGGAPRFVDQTWYGAGGLRRKYSAGTQLEVSQRIGYQDNNSIFFTPRDQGTAKMAISMSQPLLNGAGQFYNRSVVVLANLDAGIAHAQFQRDVQTFMLDLHKAFWDIYQQRAILLQRQRLLHEAHNVIRELEGRQQIDVLGSQVSRARATLNTRRANVARQEAAYKNAITKFKSLVTDPFLNQPHVCELIPIETGHTRYFEADLAASLSLALDARPEIFHAAQELKAASIRVDVSQRDLLPVLNLVLSTYVSGLQGGTNIGKSLGDQFSVGRPTYAGGLVFEVPLGNRAAHSRLTQRQLELQRSAATLEAVSANVRAEVEIAVRELSAVCKEIGSRYQTMLSQEQEIAYLYQRWRAFADDQRVAGVMFNDLLDAQERRGNAEQEFVTTQVAYRVAWVQLKQAIGILCDCRAATPPSDASLAPSSAPAPAVPTPAGPPESSDAVAARQLWQPTAPRSATLMNGPVRR